MVLSHSLRRSWPAGFVQLSTKPTLAPISAFRVIAKFRAYRAMFLSACLSTFLYLAKCVMELHESRTDASPPPVGLASSTQGLTIGDVPLRPWGAHSGAL